MYTLIALFVVALTLTALVALIAWRWNRRIARQALTLRVAQRQQAQRAEKARAMAPWSQALDWDGNPL